MRIIYIGSSSGTSFARYEALSTLGHETKIIDPYKAIPNISLLRSWSFRTGALWLETLINKYIFSQIDSSHCDLIIVDNGELISKNLICKLRKISTAIVNINYDNPYSPRDGNRWRLFLKSLPLYDKVFTCRETSVIAARAAGAQNVERIWHTVDDKLINFASHPTEEEKTPYLSQVAFIGTWMPERGPFLISLINQGVPLRIFGPRWDRAPEYNLLKNNITLGSLNTRQYESAVSASRISIGLTSKDNFDLSTHRSMEVPILGSVFCAERTEDHMRLYKDGEEAVFFDNANECAQSCISLLADPYRLSAIREAGRSRNISNSHFHRKLMAHVVGDNIA